MADTTKMYHCLCPLLFWITVFQFWSSVTGLNIDFKFFVFLSLLVTVVITVLQTSEKACMFSWESLVSWKLHHIIVHHSLIFSGDPLQILLAKQVSLFSCILT